MYCQTLYSSVLLTLSVTYANPTSTFRERKSRVLINRPVPRYLLGTDFGSAYPGRGRRQNLPQTVLLRPRKMPALAVFIGQKVTFLCEMMLNTLARTLGHSEYPSDTDHNRFASRRAGFCHLVRHSASRCASAISPDRHIEALTFFKPSVYKGAGFNLDHVVSTGVQPGKTTAEQLNIQFAALQIHLADTFGDFQFSLRSDACFYLPRDINHQMITIIEIQSGKIRPVGFPLMNRFFLNRQRAGIPSSNSTTPKRVPDPSPG